MKRAVVILNIAFATVIATSFTFPEPQKEESPLNAIDVLNESKNFLKNTVIPSGFTAREVAFDFSINDSVYGIMSGAVRLFFDSLLQKSSGTIIKTFFLNTKNPGNFKSTRNVPQNPKFTVVTTPTAFAQAIGTKDVITINYTFTGGSGVIPVKINLTVLRINTIIKDTQAANEYLLFGILDIANPKKVITIKIKQSFI